LEEKGKEYKAKIFVDLCCGSGVIGLSLAKELGMEGVMVDLNPKCVRVTEKNR
jgi:methylase of polypeptide subunit release factors